MDNMTRASVDRLGLEVLPPEECWTLVAAAPVGRVAFVDAGEPMVLPVTHGVSGHHIVFRSGRGTKLSAVEMAPSIAFEVDHWDAAHRTGWSVLVRGVGEPVYDADEVAALEGLGIDPWLESAAGGTWVRLRVDEITGRRIAA